MEALVDAQIRILKKEIEMLEKNGMVNDKVRALIRENVKQKFAQVLDESVQLIMENQ